MSNLLKEILDMVALPYQWLDSERAIFKFEDISYGIIVEYLELKLPTRIIHVSNVSFGLIKEKLQTADDLDTSLTKFGKLRTILSTVAEACLANSDLMKCDVIALAAAEQAREKRSIVYSFAISEIKTKVKAFRKDFTVKSKSGSLIMLLTKIDLTVEEQSYIKDQLGLNKV
jgi:hypothetical protein